MCDLRAEPLSDPAVVQRMVHAIRARRAVVTKRYIVLVSVEDLGTNEIEDDIEHIQLALEQFDMLVISVNPQHDGEE